MAAADPQVRSLIAEIGVNDQLAQLDAAGLVARTQKAREARMEKYRQRVDPEGRMTPADRERAAKHAMRADMARLSLLAVQARRELASLAETP